MDCKYVRLAGCFFASFIGVLLFIILFPSSTYALSRSSYYDFGNYYNNPQVLGLTISSLENLPSLAIPQSAAIPKATGILPGNPLHPFETLAENIQLTFTTDPIKKEELRLAFASERLSEAKTLTDQGQADLALETITSYKNTMEEVTQNTKSLAEKNVPGITDFVNKVEDIASAQTIAAQSLTFSSPPAVASIWNEVVSSAEHSLDQAADAAKKPSIPVQLSASIQQLKDQGLITPEESDKLYGLKSRTEVREELNKLATSGQFPLAEITTLNEVVAAKYPEVYEKTSDILEFAELRTYQTQPQPTDEILTQIKEWQDQKDTGVTPPNEIKPYLYRQRAEELAKEIDLSDFDIKQQTELARFYPQALEENKTYIAPTPVPTTTPGTAPSPAPTGASPAPTSKPLPSPTPVSAEPYLSEYKGTLPGSPGYFFKQLGEGIRFATTFDQGGKLELQMRYADERLREINALAKTGRNDSAYETSLRRYKNTMEDVSSDLKSFRGSENDKKDLAQRLENEAARHNVVFEKGLLPASKEDKKLYTEVLQSTENALDRCAGLLERPALPPQLANRLQDLKTQGLILPEEVDKLTKAQSREDVRKEIRNLVELGTFPPADAKKLDEGQTVAFPQDYNQLVEVRKVEELQRLRAVQAEFAQTATLRSTKDSYEQRIETLTNTIDPTFIKPEDLAGRPELLKAYQSLLTVSSSRPINGGQFGQDVKPGVAPGITTPAQLARQDAVLTTCPVGAVFKQSEGCVWEDTGKKINDYEQYRCASPRQYWSFTLEKCIATDNTPGVREDGYPECPLGYAWSWETQSCQASTEGGVILPSPKPEPTPANDKELEKRSQSCPEGSTYKVPLGCVWDKNGKSIYDQNQYACQRGQYYSFETSTCVPNPKSGEELKDDVHPECKDPKTAWSWKKGTCMAIEEPIQPPFIADATIIPPKPGLFTPDSPFYFIKKAGEAIQTATAFTPARRQEVWLDQAKERFAEGYYALEKQDEKAFKKAFTEYTAILQDTYKDIKENEKSLNDAQRKTIADKMSQFASENYLLKKASALTSDETLPVINSALSATIQGVDRASDVKKEPPIPQDIKSKIEALPDKMLPEAEKKKLLAIDNRVEARVKLGALVGSGALTSEDTAVFDNDLQTLDKGAVIKLEEINKLSESVKLKDLKENIEEKVEKTEQISKKLDEFQKTFKVGGEIPKEIRPYVRLTRIEEITQTIRPDLVRLEDFSNRKDIQLAVATLKEEFKPTKEAIKQIEDFRRNNPGKTLPFDLARLEGLSRFLGVREIATACFLPSPPFLPNTPCPPPGASIAIESFYGPPAFNTPFGSGQQAAGITGAPTLDKEGKPLVYGKGPQAASAGVCPNGYHWMYDSGGWCMSDGGSYGSSNYFLQGQSPYTYNASQFTSVVTSQPGYTPYSPYYTVPGVSSITSSPYTYTPPTYYGTAPTNYSTNPPPGTVPGTGPQPDSAGQCPSGFHWMPPSYNQAGWCMSDGGTYAPGNPYYPGATTSETPPTGGYNCGGQPYDPVAKKCADGACPAGFSWDGSKCAAASPNLTRESCGPGYYWSSNACFPNFSGGGSYTSCPSGYSWNGSSCQASPTYYSGWNGSTCNAPSAGCGAGLYWDSGACSCRPSTTYDGGVGPAPGNSCQGISCGGGSYLDYSTCTCKTSSATAPSCSYPSGGCGSGWFDWASCSCKTSTSTTYPTPSSTSYPTPTSGYTYPTPSSTTSTTGSCSSGYHWMSDSGGWCMSDGGTNTTYPTPSSYPTPSYGTPSYVTPSYGTPAEYSTPSYGTPTYNTPTYETPTYNSPPPYGTPDNPPPPPPSP